MENNERQRLLSEEKLEECLVNFHFVKHNNISCENTSYSLIGKHKERLLIGCAMPNPEYLKRGFISPAHRTFSHSQSLDIPLMET